MKSYRISALLLTAALLISLLSGFGLRSAESSASAAAQPALPEALQQACDLGIANEETLRRGDDICTRRGRPPPCWRRSTSCAAVWTAAI